MIIFGLFLFSHSGNRKAKLIPKFNEEQTQWKRWMWFFDTKLYLVIITLNSRLFLPRPAVAERHKCMTVNTTGCGFDSYSTILNYWILNIFNFFTLVSATQRVILIQNLAEASVLILGLCLSSYLATFLIKVELQTKIFSYYFTKKKTKIKTKRTPNPYSESQHQPP